MRLFAVLLLIIVVGVGIASRLDNLRRNAQWQQLGNFFNRALAQGEQQIEQETSDSNLAQEEDTSKEVKDGVGEVFKAGKNGNEIGEQESIKSQSNQKNLGLVPLRSLYERIAVNDALLQNLAERTERLGERERTIEARETILAALQKKIEDREGSLEKTRTEIKALLQRYEGEQSGGLKQLIGIYSSIEPKRAAAIFNELDLDIVVSLLRQMPSRRVAPILAAMDAEKARRITLELSE